MGRGKTRKRRGERGQEKGQAAAEGVGCGGKRRMNFSVQGGHCAFLDST